MICVVVTYNRKRLLAECLESLLNQSYQKFKIIIIDNNSNDNTYDYIKNFVDGNKVSYLNTKKNLGGAGGFNYGIKEAAKYNPSDIWVMDDDTIAKKDTLLNFINAKKTLKNNYSFLSSRVLWKDNTICKINKQTIDRNCLEFSNLLEKGIIRIKNSSFVSCFINIEAVYSVGLPIKEFFIWGDDTEYTERLSSYKPAYYINSSVVIHKSIETTLPAIEEDKRELFRFNYLYRNLYYIYKKANRLSKFRYLQKKHIKNVIKKAKSRKLHRIFIILKGGITGKFFKPKIEYLKRN